MSKQVKLILHPKFTITFASGGQGILLKNHPLDRETSVKLFISLKASIPFV